MESNLTDKCVWVTGGSEGVGALLVQELVERHARVVALARQDDKLQALKSRFDGKMLIAAVDVSDEKAVEGVFREMDHLQYQPDILINNAGVGSFAHIEETEVAEWRRMLDVNLTGAFLMSRQAIPRMKAKGGGTILNMNSVAGLHPFRNGAAYCASKYGLTGLTAVMREELRKQKIRIIGVHSGAIASSWWEKIPNSENLPYDHMLQPEDVVSSILHALELPDHAVQEEIVLRYVGGNF